MSSSSRESRKIWSPAKNQSLTSGHPRNDSVLTQVCPSEVRKKMNPYTKCCRLQKKKWGCKNKLEPITQVAQSSVINERVVQVDLLQKGIFVIQKVPAELAALVGAEPLCLANKPEDTSHSSIKR